MDSEKLPRRLILGSGRSGTTWVQDSLANANNLRPVFEPLHEGESKVGRRFAYGVMKTGDRCGELEKLFVNATDGRIHSPWVDYRAPSSALFPNLFAVLKTDGFRAWLWNWRKYFRVRMALRHAIQREKTLIKCIRANLMAGWLSQDLKFRTAFIVRHPCASIESRYRIGDVWDPRPVNERYRVNERLHELTDGRYVRLLNKSLSRIEALTLNWVIENQYPVDSSSRDGYSVFYYENLLSGEAKVWSDLCCALGLNSTPNPVVLRRPSQQSSEKFRRYKHFTHRPRWRESLTPKQLTEIQGVLDATACDLYTIHSDLPLRRLGGYSDTMID